MTSDDNRAAELLPCPFCGGKAEMREGKSYPQGILRFVRCTECDINRAVAYNDSPEKAAERWNTRYPPPWQRDRQAERLRVAESALEKIASQPTVHPLAVFSRRVATEALAKLRGEGGK